MPSCLWMSPRQTQRNHEAYGDSTESSRSTFPSYKLSSLHEDGTLPCCTSGWQDHYPCWLYIWLQSLHRRPKTHPNDRPCPRFRRDVTPQDTLRGREDSKLNINHSPVNLIIINYDFWFCFPFVLRVYFSAQLCFSEILASRSYISGAIFLLIWLVIFYLKYRSRQFISDSRPGTN